MAGITMLCDKEKEKERRTGRACGKAEVSGQNRTAAASRSANQKLRIKGQSKR